MKYVWCLLFLASFLGCSLQAEEPLQVSYTLYSQWEEGYSGQITLTNQSETIVTAWRVSFDLPQENSISTLWNGNYIINGISSGEITNQHVVNNTTWNGTLHPHQSTTFGFLVSGPSANALVTNISGVGNPASIPLVLSQFDLNPTYTIDSSWPTGYQTTVNIHNNTNTPTSSWAASFKLPLGQNITDLWNGVISSTSNQTITVTNPAWTGGGVIPAHGSTSFGFIVANPSSSTPILENLHALGSTDTNQPPIPSVPTLNPIAVSPSSPNTYTVSWNSVNNATSYILEQDVTSAFSNPSVVVNGAVLSHTFTNQTNGTYYYRVAAVDSSGQSAYSTPQSIVIDVPPTTLTPPVLHTINNPSQSGNYQINWSSVANAQGYNLQESTTPDFSSAVTLYHGPGTSFNVTGKAPGTYYYGVMAYSATNHSKLSNIEHVVVIQSPPPPTSTFVSGYWESWNSTETPQTIVNMHVDIIDIAFANFAATGTHTYAISGVEASPSALAQLVSAVHAAGKKVKLSIGGATYPISGQLVTPQDATGMAEAIAAYVHQNNLDGVDFDIEDYPAANLQIALIQQTRQLLGPNAVISYTPKTPAALTAPYNQVIQGAHQYLSYISFMAYDYGPGYTYQQDVTNLLAFNVPASKIVIGLMPGYDDVGVMTNISDIAAAANYVVAHGLGGIMFWDLNRDHENVTGLGTDAATNAAWNILH